MYGTVRKMLIKLYYKPIKKNQQSAGCYVQNDGDSSLVASCQSQVGGIHHVMLACSELLFVFVFMFS